MGWIEFEEGTPEVVFSSFCIRQSVSSGGGFSSSDTIAQPMLDAYYNKYKNR